MVPPTIRLLALLALGLVYATFSIRHQPPGIARLLMSLPVMLLFTMVPLQLQESVIISGSLGFLLGWLGNFKLLAYSANRGPLAYPGLRAWQWLLFLLLPYFPAKRSRTAARAHAVILSLLCKVALAVGLTFFLLGPLAVTYRVLRHTGYALYVWLFASILLDTSMPLGCVLLGHIELQPAMDKPFASVSVREFWGRRYNQIVSSILKDTIYDPIMDGAWVAVRGTLNQKRSPSGAAADMNAGSCANTAQVPLEENSRCNSNLPSSLRPPDAGVVSRRRPVIAAAAVSNIVASASLPLEDRDGGGGMMHRRVSEGRRLIAVWAAFAVSGVMHEACMM
ncbi:hypothetical protein Vretimale_8401 [Volvox reticuliferus]|nr:hypothetical protein Vretimale_8401 [Volvox reticuliferus]